MMCRLLVVSIAVSLLVVGCNTPDARLNAPPHGQPYKTADTQGTFVYMTDNALLADMTVSDMHFLPHRAKLNHLGVQRLSRLASLMDAYGGVVRFNSELDDEKLIAERVDVIVEFLAEAGVDTTREVVVQDMPGGRGMQATEVILIRANEGTYQPDKKESQASAGKTSATGK
jgi:hypothetical protein